MLRVEEGKNKNSGILKAFEPQGKRPLSRHHVNHKETQKRGKRRGCFPYGENDLGRDKKCLNPREGIHHVAGDRKKSGVGHI